MPKGHITKEEFLLEFFGNFGREFGPKQHYTDDPMEIFGFIEKCKKEKAPAFISVQPRTAHHVIYGLEKLFYDFDYGIKSDNLTERQIKHHRKKMEKEIRIFVNHIIMRNLVPLIVKTRKGYHVYIFFDRIYEIDNNEKFWKAVYGFLYDSFTESNKKKFKYADSSSRTDIFRLCRIPTSIHEKNGKECIILDSNFKPTKIRSLEYYKMYGLKRSDLIKAVDWVRVDEARKKKEAAEHEEENKDKWKVEHGFTGEIRPCFQVRMDAGEMCHMQRAALLIEAYYAGHKTREAMLNFFRWANDFDGDNTGISKCRTQIKWFFDRDVDENKNRCKIKPYRCKILEKKGWCLNGDCSIWRRRQEKLPHMKQKEHGKIGKRK